MLTHPSGVAVPSLRPLLGVSRESEIDRERERLRQELLRRILDREMRRRARRSPSR